MKTPKITISATAAANLIAEAAETYLIERQRHADTALGAAQMYHKGAWEALQAAFDEIAYAFGCRAGYALPIIKSCYRHKGYYSLWYHQGVSRERRQQIAALFMNAIHI